MDLQGIIKQGVWYLSRWWAHTRETLKAPQFWILLAVLLGLSGIFPYLTQESKREFYAQSYHYLRAGEYQKGWDEFKKAFGQGRISKLIRAGHVMAGALETPGERAQPVGDLQPPDHPGTTSPGHFSSRAEEALRQPSRPGRSGQWPGGILLALILSGVATGMVLYILKAKASYEFEFKWRIKGQEYTGKLECKNEEDLKRHLQDRGGELLEVLKKIKMAFSPAHPSGPPQSGAMKKYPEVGNDAGAGAVHSLPHDFAIGPRPADQRSAWVVHLAWCVTGFYIFFVLFWLVLGGIFLLF